MTTTLTLTVPPEKRSVFRYPSRPVRNPILRAIVRHALLIALLVIMLYPLLWMLGASLRPSNEAFNGIGLLGSRLTFENYAAGWDAGSYDFSRYFVNSTVVTLLTIAGNLFACTLAAYAFARLEFPLKRVLFALMLGTMLLPMHVTLVPQYVLFNTLGWVNTYLPLVVPHWLGVEAFYIFLMVQFIRGLPRELDESARIDGCGHVGIFLRIILPLSLPAIGTTAMFTFISAWNDFLGPLLYLNQDEIKTVPLALSTFLDATGASTYGPLFAMAILSLAPIVGFFIVSQRLLIEGIATTGLK
ncbi:carbohydrate ABC transporter permease [Microbacterium paludicola]|uniref:Carbohydrate ABC transporter permease n=1 Tax=Microbacterium paludicola TaxID=300019 RepID=A0A4Y9FSI3_9MICO|nr:carbohydrate ABC transporter permease [Microbacterium paludicola]MBF0817073.1 carbohydrate ABC transporter permease [Microbacterium paludicola]TFU32205.1 carbohydrate ABC transporter permease [Microbacterium paludicola]